MEPAIEVVLKSPITSLFKYGFRSKKLEFDDDESIEAETEFTGAQHRLVQIDVKDNMQICNARQVGVLDVAPI